MTGWIAMQSKIIGRFDDARSKVMLPESIDYGARGQWMLREPRGKLRSRMRIIRCDGLVKNSCCLAKWKSVCPAGKG